MRRENGKGQRDTDKNERTGGWERRGDKRAGAETEEVTRQNERTTEMERLAYLHTCVSLKS